MKNFYAVQKLTLTLLLIIISASFSWAQVPATYFDSANGLTGSALKQELHDIITNGHVKLDYGDLWTAYGTTDVYPAPNNTYIWCTYSGDAASNASYSGTAPYYLDYPTDQDDGTLGGNENERYNREHSIPNSWWGGTGKETAVTDPQYTDLHNLFATDKYVNNLRQAYPYGEVTSASTTTLNGSKLGPNDVAGSGFTGTVFEPIDAFKGDVARGYFYFAVRYKDEIPGWVTSYSGTDIDVVFTSTGDFQPWYYEMLLSWHLADPPSAKETARNDAIYNTNQKNANPFVHNPGWVCDIWGGCTINPEPSEQPTNLTATASSGSQIDLTWTDAAGANLPTGYLIMANTTGTFTAPADATDPATDTDMSDGEGLVKVSHGSGASYDFTGLNGSTTYYFKMWSYANSGGDIDFKLNGTPPTTNATTPAGPPPATVCGTETFDNIPAPSSSASTRTWTGQDGSTWTATNARTDQTINGKAITLDDDKANTYIESGTITGGIGDITITTDLPFSDNGTEPPSLYVNATFIGTIPYGADPITTTFSNVNISEDVIIKIDNSNLEGRITFDDITWTCYSAASTPAITVTPATLSGYSYVVGSGPSTSQSFSLSGSDLNNTDISIAAPTNYEVSLDDTNFGTSQNITTAHANYDGTTLTATTIYVRLKAGLTAGTYNSENVTVSGGGASDITIANNGEVTAAPNPEPDNYPTSFTATAAGSSQIDLSWTDATGTNLPDGYLIKANTTGTFTDPTDTNDPTEDTDLSDGTALVKVAHGSGASHTFTGLSASTTYYFKIWPYSNSGSDIDFKTDGTTPEANATTDASSDVFYTKITSIDDLTDDYYVIVNSGDATAMNNTNGGSYFEHTAVSPVSNVITNPDASIVWKIETNGTGSFSIYNETSAKFVSYTGSSNAAYAVDAVTSDNQRWTFSYASSEFSCTNKAITDRILQYNAGAPRFACYTSAQQEFLLYKKEPVSTDPTLNVSTATLTSFGDICSGETSSETSYTVSGSNLTDDIVITPPANFEISETSGSGFVANPSTITLTQSGGDVAETTIYVRFKPTAIQPYSDNITHTSTGATQKDVAVSGSGVCTAPTIGSPSSTNMTTSAADLGGNIMDLGCTDVSKIGIEYSTTDGFTEGTGTDVNETTGSPYATGAFTLNVTGLSSATTYYYKAYAENSCGKTYTAQGSFSTIKPEPSNYPTNFSCASDITHNSMVITWTDASTGTLPDGYLLKWGTSYGAVAEPADGTPEADDTGTTGSGTVNISHGTETYTVQNLNPSTDYYFKIWPYTNTGSSIDYKLSSEPQTSCQTIAGPVTLYSGSYEPDDELWTIHSAGGTGDWERTTDGGTYSPGDSGHDGTWYMWFYGWGNDADDWIISPSYDFSGYSNISMTLWTWYRNAGTDIVMKASSDYDGNTANIGTATWTDIPFTKPSSAETWTSSGSLDLRAYDGESSVYIAFYYSGTDVDKNWAVDDYEILGTLASTTDQTTEALAPETQQAAATIASTIDTEGEAQDVFKFKIHDDGASDGEATNVTQITIKNANPTNGADWSDNIQGIRLYNSTTSSYVTTGTPVITDTEITIPITAGNLIIADGGTVELTMSLYLNTANIEDGKNLQFFIDADAHGFTSVVSQSRFAASFTGDITSNEFTIAVSATKLMFAANEPPAQGVVNQNMPATVQATDANGNIDTDATEEVTLSKASGTGTMTPDNDAQNLINGTYTWNIQFDASGDYTVLASATGLTDVTSGTVSITNIFKYQGFQDPDLPKDNWSYSLPAGDPYESNDANLNLTPIDGWSLHMDGGDELIMDEIDITNYTNVKFSFIFAADGANSGHEINLRVSYDGGLSWESEVMIADGYSGATYDFGATNPDDPFHPQNPYILEINDTKSSFMAKIYTGSTYYIDEVQLEGIYNPLTVHTLNHMGVTENSAIVNSEIVNDGGQTITERGIIYCEDPAPATFKIGETGVTKEIEGNTTIGYYTVNLSGLSIATTYHARAYVLTNSETIYGETVTFITCDGVSECVNNTDIIISEYIESSGGGTNNAIELYNGTGSDINLKHYTLRYDNGSAGWNTYETANHYELGDVILAKGNTYVLAHSAANAPELELIPSGQANVRINLAIGGDEQIQLLKNDTPIEHVGWESNFGEATTFARRPDIRSPRTRSAPNDGTDQSCDPNTNGEWVIYPDNYYDDLSNHRDPFSWTGTESSDWFTTDNWNLNRIPSYSASVVIDASAPTMPIIEDPLSEGNEAGAYNVTIEPGSSITIAPTGKMTIQNTISLNSPDEFVIQSTDAGTGSLILLGSGFEATIERYLKGSQWHYLFSPLSAILTSTYSEGGNNNLYSYDETKADYWDAANLYGINGWSPEYANTYLPSDKAYIFNPYNMSDKIYTQSGGTLKTDDMQFSVNHTESGTGSVNENGVTEDWTYFDGWNLMGNPYTSAIDWDAVIKTNIEAGIYVFDGNNYQYYISDGTDSPYNIGITLNGGSQYIPAGQGFMVKANTGGGTFTIPATARVHNGQSFWKKSDNSAPNLLRLHIDKDGFTDETIYRTLPEATGVSNEHDGKYDAYKMFSLDKTRPQIFTQSTDGAKLYAVNSMTEISNYRVVPLGLYMGEAGEYELSITENSFENIHLWLEDTHTDEMINLREINSWKLNQTAEDNRDRYVLHFNKNSQPQSNADLPNQAFKLNETLYFELPKEAFTDTDFGDTLTYSAAMSDGSELPEWLSFNPEVLSFSGEALELGNFAISINAKDVFNETAENNFVLEIYETTGENDVTGNTISIYPNPADDKLHIRSLSDEIKAVKVVDISGKLIVQKNLAEKRFSLDLSELSEGMYFIEIQTISETIRKSFIKQQI